MKPRGRKSRKTWTPEMESKIRELYPVIGMAAAGELGISPSAAKQRAIRLGVRAPVNGYTDKELEAVRVGYEAGLTAETIAAEIGRSVASVRRQAYVRGIRSSRAWTEAETAVVRDRYRTDGATALARELLGADDPHSVMQVYRLASRLKVSSPTRHSPETYARVRELHARGMNDPQITEAMSGTIGTGRNDRERITAIRRRMGLPRVEQTYEQRRAMGRAGRQKQLQSGVNPRDAAFAKLATSYGLPPDTPPRAVEILLALAGGPKTRDEVKAATGKDPVDIWNALSRGYMGGLIHRGLVVATKLPGASNRGSRFVYMLTAAAIELLARGGADAAGQG